MQALGLGSGGAWEPPLVGTDGSVTFGIGNPYQSIGEAIAHPSQAALHRQRGEPGRRDRESCAGTTRPCRTTSRTTTCRRRRSRPVNGVPAIIAGGKVGYVYALNARTGALLVEDAGRRAQRARQRLRARAVAPAHRSSFRTPCCRDRSAASCRTWPWRTAACTSPPLMSRSPTRAPSTVDGNKAAGADDRGGGGAQPCHRQGRMGHQGPVAAARRGHRLERPGLHHSLQRRVARAQPRAPARSSTGTSCPPRRTHRSRSSATRCWSRRAAR